MAGHVPMMSIEARVAEVVRCARGVVQTTDRQKIGVAVVHQWWDALVEAINDLDEDHADD